PDRPGLRVRRLSNTAIALLLASRPVTTRRISAAVAVEHANMTAMIDQNVLRIIASSLVLPERRRRWAAHAAAPASAGRYRSRPLTPAPACGPVCRSDSAEARRDRCR